MLGVSAGGEGQGHRDLFKVDFPSNEPAELGLCQTPPPHHLHSPNAGINANYGLII